MYLDPAVSVSLRRGRLGDHLSGPEKAQARLQSDAVIPVIFRLYSLFPYFQLYAAYTAYCAGRSFLLAVITGRFAVEPVKLPGEIIGVVKTGPEGDLADR